MKPVDESPPNAADDQDQDSWEGYDFTDPNSRLAPYYFQASHVIAAIMLLLALFVFSMLPLVHSDLWGHMKFGEYIVTNRALPPHEMFSNYSDPAQPYVGYMWLSQVAYYGVYQAGAALAGPAGGGEMVRTFHAIVTCLKLLLLLLAYRRSCGSLPLALFGLTLLLILYFGPLGVQRPQVFGELFFAWALFLLSGPLTWRGVLLLPLIMAAWANFHGSYLIGGGLMGIFFVGRLIETGWRDEQLRRIAIALALTPLAIGLLHPYGFGIFQATLSFASAPNVKTVAEWQPLDFHRTAGGHWGYVAILVLFVISQALSRQTLSPTRVLLTVVFGVAPLFQERLMTWWVLLFPWVLLPLWQDFRGWTPQSWRWESVPSLRKTLFCMALTVIALLWTGAVQILIGNPPIAMKDMVTQVTMLDFMNHVHGDADPVWTQRLKDYPNGKFQGNVFTSDNLGDYPIWLEAKKAPVLVYSHVQFFPTGVWDDFTSMLWGKPGWDELFQRYRINMVWIEPDKNTVLADAIRENEADWTILIDDMRPGEAPSRWLYKRFVALRKKPI